MTWGELAMLLAPRGEAIGRRVAKIRETGAPQHANWGGHGLVRRAGDPEVRHGPRRHPSAACPSDFFAPAKGYTTRRQVYEAYRI